MKNEAKTRDHIPPKGLFVGVEKPYNLVTVPCCEKCNIGSSKDDEYFLMFLALVDGDLANKYKKALFNKQKKISERPQSLGLYNSLKNSTGISTIISSGGIYLPNQPLIEINQSRIKNVLSRILKGLAYYEGKYICNSVEIVIDHDKVLKNEEMVKLLKDTYSYLVDIPFKVIGNDQVFCYKYVLPKSLPFLSFWHLRIFNTFHVLGYCEHDKEFL